MFYVSVSNLNTMCGDRLWAFERAVGAFLEGFDDREERNVQTKTECEKLCLFESSFTCRYQYEKLSFQIFSVRKCYARYRALFMCNLLLLKIN